jgi:hypothetical protein
MPTTKLAASRYTTDALPWRPDLVDQQPDDR